MPAYMTVEIYCETALDPVISSINVPNGSPGCLTGTTDLPAGDHDVYIRLSTPDFGASGEYVGASLQIILGQTVDEPGCRPEGGGIG